MQSSSLNNILLVEDEEDIRTIAKIALEDIGHFNVQYAKSGFDALQITKEYQPDLIILDVMMPVMDGIETYHALRKSPNLFQVPVIFMTAKIQMSEIKQYHQLGAIEVISKPFDPITLADQLLATWRRYHHE